MQITKPEELVHAYIIVGIQITNLYFYNLVIIILFSCF